MLDFATRSDVFTTIWEKEMNKICAFFIRIKLHSSATYIKTKNLKINFKENIYFYNYVLWALTVVYVGVGPRVESIVW